MRSTASGLESLVHTIEDLAASNGAESRREIVAERLRH
jgi:hypothetical protein